MELKKNPELLQNVAIRTKRPKRPGSAMPTRRQEAAAHEGHEEEKGQLLPEIQGLDTGSMEKCDVQWWEHLPTCKRGLQGGEKAQWRVLIHH